MIGFFLIASIWAWYASFFRYLAAKERVGAGKNWLPDFLSNGWAKAESPRGRMYVRATVVIGFVLPPVFMALFIVGGKLRWWG